MGRVRRQRGKKRKKKQQSAQENVILTAWTAGVRKHMHIHKSKSEAINTEVKQGPAG